MSQYQTVIIGAGFAGIIAALRLKASGRNNFVILERASEVGGTWRDNTYPGCACDVPTPLYSISSEPNPNWSRFFAPQQEIFEYMKNVVDKNDLRKHIRFGIDVFKQEFDEKEGIWNLTARNGEKFSGRLVIMAMGPFSKPKLPEIQGMENFKGKSFHSASWDYSYNLSGKKVAVIGTGASAIQIVPSIAPDVSELYVFQRTPAWIAPRFDRAIDEKSRSRYSRFPWIQKTIRNALYWIMELRGRSFIGNMTIRKFLTKQSLKKLETEVLNPELRKKLTPNYEIGCKRILSSDDYLPTFNRPNVHLITNVVEKITENGIETADGTEINFDAIVYATGFDAAEINLDASIVGLNNRELLSDWKKTGIQAFRGTTISGFPNLAFLLGPNTGLGHSSVLHIMESQMNYIMGYLDFLEKLPHQKYLNIKKDDQEKYNQHIQSLFKGTVWSSGCSSWYLNSQGRNTTLYPRLTAQFRRETKHFDGSVYETLSAKYGV